MSLMWSGTMREDTTCNLGSLAVVAPLLEQMDIARIIDRHLPRDPQQEYAYGQVLTLLLAARLCQPLALVNVANWAERSAAECLWDIPADKLNDDRLGRALDAFFKHRHSIQASVAAYVVSTFHLPTDRLHYDTTHLLFTGDYATSTAAPEDLPLPPLTPSASFPPAHITHGYPVKDDKLIHVGLCSVVDDLGGVPLVGHTINGNDNGHTAIAEQFHFLQQYHPHLLTEDTLLISDRGTYSAAHVARLERAGCHALCAVPWGEMQALFDERRGQMFWQNASYLSVEQRRRRQSSSALPQEHYELAVVRHHLTDPDNGERLPVRIIFVFSSADQKICQTQRARDVARIRDRLERAGRSVARGHAHYTDPVDIHRRIVNLLGQGRAARFFRWELVPLTNEEKAALPAPQRGCRRPTHRLVFQCDEQAVQAAAAYDGYSALLTTAPLRHSADSLFTQYKQQCYVEQGHHQWKTPIAVRPLFLKSPQRVEALVYLLQIALTAYHLLQRQYRQAVPDDEPWEKRLTTESILRAFRQCTVAKEDTALGCVIHPEQLTSRQRQILNRLGFSTPAQTLSRRLPRYPPQ